MMPMWGPSTMHVRRHALKWHVQGWTHIHILALLWRWRAGVLATRWSRIAVHTPSGRDEISAFQENLGLLGGAARLDALDHGCTHLSQRVPLPRGIAKHAGLEELESFFELHPGALRSVVRQPCVDEEAVNLDATIHGNHRHMNVHVTQETVHIHRPALAQRTSHLPSGDTGDRVEGGIGAFSSCDLFDTCHQILLAAVDDLIGSEMLELLVLLRVVAAHNVDGLDTPALGQQDNLPPN
mmetsp:Transcript_1051/g.3214  ORF Transcript_1051/g.3214 Transcript_1051/m.3214 type:complete len:239 (-) Transcript_1051:710-1426(-)